ncbi:unnamed protein product [Soboliphyme baturini]|uniref:Uncharacterized protein n=1 Tax=Soboliphyme baturini TaxID=241478 RepID=A0A183IRY9_9BILA|nr:unnamed protein product [Soboliphyme baturini]
MADTVSGRISINVAAVDVRLTAGGRARSVEQLPSQADGPRLLLQRFFRLTISKHHLGETGSDTNTTEFASKPEQKSHKTRTR